MFERFKNWLWSLIIARQDQQYLDRVYEQKDEFLKLKGIVSLTARDLDVTLDRMNNLHKEFDLQMTKTLDNVQKTFIRILEKLDDQTTLLNEERNK